MIERRDLTFAQAEGVEALPSQLALRTISSELSAALWAATYTSLLNCVKREYGSYGSPILGHPWSGILISWWVTVKHKNIDEFPSDAQTLIELVKSEITSRNYVRVFDIIQFIIRHKDSPFEFSENISELLKFCRASYRVVDKTIIPIGSEEEATAIMAAMETASRATAQGPRTHLRDAGAALSQGKWAESVRDSIHAVEAAAKSIEPTAATLGPALTKLQQSISLNPVMSKAFSKLYGYSCDEKGVRHALVFDGVSTVTERDALFMFGACAAFVSYLLSSERTV